MNSRGKYAGIVFTARLLSLAALQLGIGAELQAQVTVTNTGSGGSSGILMTNGGALAAAGSSPGPAQVSIFADSGSSRGKINNGGFLSGGALPIATWPCTTPVSGNVGGIVYGSTGTPNPNGYQQETCLPGNTLATEGLLSEDTTGAPSWIGTTGTGSAVLASSPVLVGPTLGVALVTTINGLAPTALSNGFTIAGGTTTTKTLTVTSTGTIGSLAYLSTAPIANGGTSATTATAGTVPNATSTLAASWTATPTFGVQNTTAGGLTLAGSSSAGGSLTLAGTGASPSTSTIAVTPAGTTLELGSTNAEVDTSGNFSAGTWKGSLVGPPYGGTGVNNGSNTLTLGASLATTGTGAPTLAFPATTPYAYTYPANTGTLAELGFAQTWGGLQTFGTNISIAGVTPAGATGTGNIVFSAAPTLSGNLTQTGTTTTYNNIATVNNGMAAQVASIYRTGLFAAIATTTLYTPVATGFFRVCGNAKVTTVATTSSNLGASTGLVIGYTDGTDSTVQAPVLGGFVQNGTTIPATGNNSNSLATQNIFNCSTIYAKTGVAITYAYGYSSTGATAMQYTLRLTLESL